MRRSDRGTDEAWIKHMLHTEAVGVLATEHEGQPFINTNLYFYDEAAHAIYTHTARTGRTRSNVDHAQKACFSVFTMGRLLPADVALEFSVEYAGVVIFGNMSIVDEEAPATDALQKLLDKYAPHLTAGKDYRPPVHEELVATSVFKLDIEGWTGKKKEVEDDFPGAFEYGDPNLFPQFKNGDAS
jgi:hypothetical protein